jgi:hypothetical protein
MNLTIHEALEAIQIYRVLLVWMYTIFSNIMMHQDNIFPFSESHTLLNATYCLDLKGQFLNVILDVWSIL